MRSLFIVLMVACSLMAGDRMYGNTRLTEVIRVYDGDTFYGLVKSWPRIIGDTIGIRVYGIDTPEMRGSSDSIKILAIQAKKFAEEFLMSGGRVRLKDMRRGKYFRIVAEVWVGRKSLAEELIKAGLARPYDGGTKQTW